MSFRSPSFCPASCCLPGNCDYEDGATAEQPCWGQVRVVGEEDDGEGGPMWMHACGGHAGIYEMEPYIVEGSQPEPEPRPALVVVPPPEPDWEKHDAAIRALGDLRAFEDATLIKLKF